MYSNWSKFHDVTNNYYKGNLHSIMQKFYCTDNIISYVVNANYLVPYLLLSLYYLILLLLPLILLENDASCPD